MPEYWFISFTSWRCHPPSIQRFVYSDFSEAWLSLNGLLRLEGSLETGVGVMEGKDWLDVLMRFLHHAHDKIAVLVSHSGVHWPQLGSLLEEELSVQFLTQLSDCYWCNWHLFLKTSQTNVPACWGSGCPGKKSTAPPTQLNLQSCFWGNKFYLAQKCLSERHCLLATT